MADDQDELASTGKHQGDRRGADAVQDDEVTYEPCGRLGPHEPHVWLSRKTRNCTGSGEPGHTDPKARG